MVNWKFWEKDNGTSSDPAKPAAAEPATAAPAPAATEPVKNTQDPYILGADGKVALDPNGFRVTNPDWAPNEAELAGRRNNVAWDVVEAREAIHARSPDATGPLFPDKTTRQAAVDELRALPDNELIGEHNSALKELADTVQKSGKPGSKKAPNVQAGMNSALTDGASVLPAVAQLSGLQRAKEQAGNFLTAGRFGKAGVTVGNMVGAGTGVGIMVNARNRTSTFGKVTQTLVGGLVAAGHVAAMVGGHSNIGAAASDWGSKIKAGMGKSPGGQGI